MKVLVVYDSEFGNTEIVARAIGDVLGSDGEVEIHRVHDIQPEGIMGLDVLIVGSPTQQFKPTGATSNFLKRIPKKRGNLIHPPEGFLVEGIQGPRV